MCIQSQRYVIPFSRILPNTFKAPFKSLFLQIQKPSLIIFGNIVRHNNSDSKPNLKFDTFNSAPNIRNTLIPKTCILALPHLIRYNNHTSNKHLLSKF